MVVVKCIIDEIPEEVYAVLAELGVPSHIAGYDLMAYASYLLMNDYERELRLVYDIYPEVAKAFNKSRVTVERSIRYAITYIFNNTDPDVLERYFYNSIPINKGQVSNEQFLRTAVRLIRKKLLT